MEAWAKKKPTVINDGKLDFFTVINDGKLVFTILLHLILSFEFTRRCNSILPILTYRRFVLSSIDITIYLLAVTLFESV